MSFQLASLAALASLWLAVALLVALAARVLWPIVARIGASRDPETRARLAFLAAVSPVLVPSGVVLLCALPGLLGALTGAGDHCSGHGTHPHFCPVHATLAMTPLLGLGLAAFATLVASQIVQTAFFGLALAREQRWLERRRVGELEPGVHLLSGDTPIALTCGVAAPEIWLAQGLLGALDEQDRSVVLAHERAHVARRDPARFLAASVASRLLFPSVRADVLRALRLSAEQACDARAAECIGDDLQVAATLLRVERLMQRAPRALAFAVTLVDASLPARIAALVSRSEQTTTHRASGRRWPWILAVAALLLASPVHHLAEHALEALLRSMVGLDLLS
jgi:Zn-dependent protease with chaperone function